jgi:hypothetical protein
MCALTSRLFFKYPCDTLVLYEEYTKTFAPALQVVHQVRFGEHAHGIRTILEFLGEF